MQHPAYFLTWTTRGSWLHGDERGSVDREHNARGTSLISPDKKRNEAAKKRLKSESVVLTQFQRFMVQNAIERVCAHRNWKLLAVNVRSNHVHVVVIAPDRKPEHVMGQLKSWATRDLRERGEVDPNGRVWTNQGSTRWIKDEKSLGMAIDYVFNHQ